MTKQQDKSFQVSFAIEAVNGDTLCNIGGRLTIMENGQLRKIVIRTIQSIRVTEDGRHIIIKGTYRLLEG